MRTDCPVAWMVGKVVRVGFVQDYVVRPNDETCAVVWTARELVRVPLSSIETMATAPMYQESGDD